MSSSSEKLVKQTIKLIAKKYKLDYEELKDTSKKMIKLSRVYDQEMMGMMEELLDLGNVGAPDELAEFNTEVLRLYCRIKELDDQGSDKSIKQRVWNNIEEEFQLNDEDDEEEEEEPPPPPPEIIKKKKDKKQVVVIE